MSTLSIHLDRLLQPLVSLLPADVAAKVADLRADDATQERVDYLADRATEGTLTVEERAEYAGYVQAIDVIAALQARARSQITGQ
jgi:CBS-domain-containing membrane protein